MGTFENDQMHGNGTLFYPDGKKYSGGFIFGKRHGKGIFTYADGSAYVGKFNSGKEEGVGECINMEGESNVCKSKTDAETQQFVDEDSMKIEIKSIEESKRYNYKKDFKG